ncbi:MULTISPECIES: hypothetical protein [Enterobacter cloacae complex]|uniref:hypothetical protein n=1 Tax=Enterobacter cloacae complex TaxID=354276 RepID=UPI0015D503BC|nr:MULTISPECIES: hypothetical protein [Enterobacter cloacae complex]EHN8719235.1 hypothetical protein [Enterobacter hormaechei]MCE1498770.1 hypothetical protein [Enterobacter hormaechei]MCM7179995.1 hypothetical protein [Enterobacter hormaechei]MDO6165522.1 hypothetical protein [Enterobacter hormaechei]MDO6169789.1 hypothetical protein [Enterobacter hormaechei]
MQTVSTYKDLAKAIACDSNKIEVTGDITKGTVKIVASGAVSWAIAIGAISIAYVAFVMTPATGGTSSTLSLMAAPAAVASIGLPATTAAIAIVTGAGSLTAIKNLRKYKVESFKDGKAILVKK